jgi:hypothetical protein
MENVGSDAALHCDVCNDMPGASHQAKTAAFSAAPCRRRLTVVSLFIASNCCYVDAIRAARLAEIKMTLSDAYLRARRRSIVTGGPECRGDVTPAHVRNPVRPNGQLARRSGLRRAVRHAATFDWTCTSTTSRCQGKVRRTRSRVRAFAEAIRQCIYPRAGRVRVPRCACAATMARKTGSA